MRTHRPLLFLILAILALFAAGVGYDLAVNTPALHTPEGQAPGGMSIATTQDMPSEPAPDVVFTTLEEGAFTLKDFTGKVVLLNFWASWCAPCIQEFPSFLRLLEAQQGKVVLIAVSIDERKELIDAFLKRFKDKQPLQNPWLHIAWDKDKTITHKTFHSYRMPETIIINPDGIMVRKIAGGTEWDTPEMTTYVESLLP